MVVNVEGSNVKVVQLNAIKNDILLLCALCDTLPSHYVIRGRKAV